MCRISITFGRPKPCSSGSGLVVGIWSPKILIGLLAFSTEKNSKALLDYLGEAVPDVQIEYQFIDNSNYDTIVDTQLSAGEGPDIICESPASALKHAKLGYLADVSDLGAKFSDAGTSVYSYDGKTYALPGISWFEGIYYNVDLFEQNNIALPTTFDEYLDATSTTASSDTSALTSVPRCIRAASSSLASPSPRRSLRATTSSSVSST